MNSLLSIPVLTPQQQQTLSAREDRLKRTLRLAQLLAVAATGFIVTGAIKANNEDEHVRGDGYIFLFAGASSLMFSTLFCFNYYNRQEPNPNNSPTTQIKNNHKVSGQFMLLLLVVKIFLVCRKENKF
jgi:hypothetical protein